MTKSLNELLNNSRTAVSYMMKEITHICRDMKKREPGSKGEREAAEYMAGLLKNECGCSNVRTETFRTHPDAFYGYFYFSASCGLLSVAGFFIQPYISLIFGIIGLLLFLF